MKTTLRKIKSCVTSLVFAELLQLHGKTEADDEPINVSAILASHGLMEALQCLPKVDGYEREIRLFAVWDAQQYEHLLTDERSKAAISVAERYANGEATSDELRAASAAAWYAADSSIDAPYNDTGCGVPSSETLAAVRAWCATGPTLKVDDESRLRQTQELQRVLSSISKGEDPYPKEQV